VIKPKRKLTKEPTATFSKFRPHPWHGISPGKNPPELVTAYIEITPTDGMKYEIDKDTGYLKVDRPQRTSSLPPALYGFIPQTYCGDRVTKLAPTAKRGDGDPLDICVLSERPITRNEILVPARVIGGLRMIDKGEADDKIIAVLESDPYWDELKELDDLSEVLKSRLEHYFMTYKMVPGGKTPVKLGAFYGSKHAEKVILAAMADYKDEFS
jgi:inorganic pyrophosphatase